MKKRTLLVILSILTFLIIWQVVFCLIDTNIILPAPSKVLPIIARSLLNRETLHVIWQTAWKVLLALVFSTVLGILSGFFSREIYFPFSFHPPLDHGYSIRTGDFLVDVGNICLGNRVEGSGIYLGAVSLARSHFYNDFRSP